MRTIHADALEKFKISLSKYGLIAFAVKIDIFQRLLITASPMSILMIDISKV